MESGSGLLARAYWERKELMMVLLVLTKHEKDFLIPTRSPCGCANYEICYEHLVKLWERSVSFSRCAFFCFYFFRRRIPWYLAVVNFFARSLLTCE